MPDHPATLTRAQTVALAGLMRGYGQDERATLRPMRGTGAVYVTLPNHDGPIHRRIAADGTVTRTLAERRSRLVRLSRSIPNGPSIPARIGPGREVS